MEISPNTSIALFPVAGFDIGHDDSGGVLIRILYESESHEPGTFHPGLLHGLEPNEAYELGLELLELGRQGPR